MAACGAPEPEPTWTRLATRVAQFSDRAPGELASGVRLSISEHGVPEVSLQIPPEAFTPEPAFPGVLVTSLPASFHGLLHGEPWLELDVRDIESLAAVRELLRLPGSEAGFHIMGDRLFVRPPDGAPTVPATLTLSLAVRSREGDAWRVRGPRYHADGWRLLTGEAVEVDVPLGTDWALSLGLAMLPLELGPDREPTRLIVELEGEVLVDREVRPFSERAELVRLPLPDGGGAGRLELAASGGAALVLVLEPVIGPAHIGTYGDRPWTETQPDLVVLLADTFRADNMTLYRGAPGGVDLPLTPHLDVLADESVRFLRAWAPSSWTLPSQASLLTGLEPRRHGAVSRELRLPRAIVTLAERLTEAGYRTANVNDQGFLVAEFGLDQGFQRHDERKSPTHDLAETVRRVDEFLAADDGRPVFLYVQSYRAHAPYWAVPESRALVGTRLPAAEAYGPGLEALGRAAALGGLVEDPDPSPLAAQTVAPTAEVLARMKAMRGLYLAGVRDTDRGFGELLDRLDATGVGRAGYVLFTSDHGEAFGEHRAMTHGVAGYEVMTRVPLLVRGPGLAPRDVAWPVSLIDVEPTLLGLAGLAPSPGRSGSSLLDVDRVRWVLLEEVRTDGGLDSWAAVLGARKVYAGERFATPVQVDLAADPAEQHPLVPGDPRYDPMLTTELARLREATLDPVHAQEPVDLTPTRRAKLRALGYLDD